ncbi:MAG: hypothetical protein ACYS0I_01585 [Planctomycetota bacterium]|jgi:hypothetical protein
MIFDVSILIKVLLFSLGVYWCYKVIDRFENDLQKLRKGEDKLRKAVVLGIWTITVVIAILLVKFSIPLIDKIAPALRGLKALF